MNFKSKQFKGKLVAAAIRNKANEMGVSIKVMAEILGISHIYLSSLINGIRPFSGLSCDKQQAIATLLGITKIELFVMIGQLSAEDLVINMNSNTMTFQNLRSNPNLQVVNLTASDWDSSSERMRLMVALLYQQLQASLIMQSSSALNVAAAQ